MAPTSSKPWTAAVALIVGLALGIVAGFIAAGSGVASDPSPVTVSTDTRSPAAPDANVRNNEPGVRHDAGPAPKAEARAQACEVERDAALKTTASLQKEVQSLRRKLSFEQTFREEIEGTPTAFPDNADARFREEAFVEQLKKSIDSTGIEAVVENVDCDEFPCIAYGVVGSDISAEAALADLKLLHEETYKGEYKSDQFYISHTAQEPADGEEGDSVVIFNITYYPSDLEPDTTTAVQKRLKYRKDRYFDSLR